MAYVLGGPYLLFITIDLNLYTSGGLYLPFLDYEDLFTFSVVPRSFSLFFSFLLFYEINITDNVGNVKEKFENIKNNFNINYTNNSKATNILKIINKQNTGANIRKNQGSHVLRIMSVCIFAFVSGKTIHINL